MIDEQKRKKVIDGLELCLKGLSEICPYKDSDAPGGCKDELMYDALVLLEAQEPVEPKATQGHIGSPIWQCGKCGSWIGNEMVSYCWHCGRPVKWE